MTNTELVEFCRQAACLPTKYMWGTYGRKITADLINAKTKQYPDHYPEAYRKELTACISTHLGCDCTGLIKWFLWSGGDISVTPKYNPGTDRSASGWYSAAAVRGTLPSLPETPGIILSMSGHCGVYAGGGFVYECTKGKFGNGVVRTKLADRPWEKWCHCPELDYITPQEPEDTDLKADYEFFNRDKTTVVFANENLTVPIGSLNKSTVCPCLGTLGDSAAVLYLTSALGWKIGFVRTEHGAVIAKKG